MDETIDRRPKEKFSAYVQRRQDALGLSNTQVGRQIDMSGGNLRACQ